MYIFIACHKLLYLHFYICELFTPYIPMLFFNLIFSTVYDTVKKKKKNNQRQLLFAEKSQGYFEIYKREE